MPLLQADGQQAGGAEAAAAAATAAAAAAEDGQPGQGFSQGPGWQGTAAVAVSRLSPVTMPVCAPASTLGRELATSI